MRLHPAPGAAVAAALTLLTAAPTLAQTWTVVEDSDWCRERKRNERACEVRETTVPADRDVILVDASKNGGIEVEGWDRSEILIRAKVSVWDEHLDREEAAEILSEVEIEAGEEIRARGPSRRGGRSWSVDYRLMVPEKSNLTLESYNGGIEIFDVFGDIRLETHNGGIRVGHVGGDVLGRTRNGGISVRLEGDAWDGEGLDLESHNGGISVEIPRDYSARLLTGTKNGGISSDFRIPNRDRQRNKTVQATLGEGGALIRIMTHNGGIDIDAT